MVREIEMANSLLIVAGAILQLLGLAGCLLPVLAGPPLNFLGLLLLGLALGWEVFSPTIWLILAGVTVLTMILDYALPLSGARKYGALFCFPPLVLFLVLSWARWQVSFWPAKKIGKP
jgi:uncharacterized protein YqgC (DUF456 family)